MNQSKELLRQELRTILNLQAVTATELADLRKENANYREENTDLREAVVKLRREKTAARAEIAQLIAMNDRQRETIGQLHRITRSGLRLPFGISIRISRNE